MELAKKDLEQLKKMLPDVEANFPTVEQLEKKARASVQTSQIYINHTLMDLLKAHEDRVREGYVLMHGHIIAGVGKYKTRYSLPPELLKKQQEEAIRAALEQREDAIKTAKEDALNELIGEHLEQQKQTKELQAKQEQEKLKEKLLQQLFS